MTTPKHMMKIDKILIGLIIGSTCPLLISLLSFTTWFYLDKNMGRPLIYLLVGLFLGLAIDYKLLRGWINKRYELPNWFIIGVYFFYNIGIYGLFMGFPVFNVLMGLAAGYYYGRKIEFENVPIDKRPLLIKKVSLFSAAIMTFFCISSALIALMDKTTGENVRLMMGLNFEITKTMLLILIFVGGFVLIVSKYFITKLTMIKTIGLNKKLQLIRDMANRG